MTRQSASLNESQSLGLTVVVPVKNAPHLEDCLESIAQSSTLPAETIIVDSSDEPIRPPADLVARARARVISRAVGQLLAKSIGAREATAGLVLFLDADQQVSPALIDELLQLDSPITAIPEETRGDGWVTALQTLNGRFLWHKFSRQPSLQIPVIPRCFDRGLLNRGLDLLHGRYQDLSALPHLHEDSLLFRCVLESSGIDPLKIRCARSLIYHESVELRPLVRKAFYYGKDRGARSASLYGVDAQLHRRDRQLLLDLDVYRWRPYIGPCVNLAGVVYDGIRVGPFIAGLLRGKSGRSRDESPTNPHRSLGYDSVATEGQRRIPAGPRA